MNLGMPGNEVKLVAHNQEWTEEFLKVQEDIKNSTALGVERIEHIGSTAIKEIVAKPILDILVGIDSFETLEDSFFKKFQKIGFYKLKVVRENEIVLAKFIDTSFKEKTHFIHLVKYKGTLWSDLIFFRDYLNSNQSARKEYEELKLAFVQNQKGDINDYTNHKEDFVKKVIEKNK
ncbi:GrpB family protein [Peribacillus simplex]|uniref:GrpB family protein n=1 Tax=Peribacillus simplex TaxID=1478 RepID=UPI003CEC0C56